MGKPVYSLCWKIRYRSAAERSEFFELVCLMVAIQFSHRFFGVQPKGSEGRQLRQKLSSKLLCVPATGVEVPGELVEVAADLAALSQQVRENIQRVLSTASNKNDVLDRFLQQRLTNEG